MRRWPSEQRDVFLRLQQAVNLSQAPVGRFRPANVEVIAFFGKQDDRLGRQRSDEIGGELRIESAPGKGTNISLKVPRLRRT